MSVSECRKKWKRGRLLIDVLLGNLTNGYIGHKKKYSLGKEKISAYLAALNYISIKRRLFDDIFRYSPLVLHS